jgi:hypothetical protein
MNLLRPIFSLEPRNQAFFSSLGSPSATNGPAVPAGKSSRGRVTNFAPPRRLLRTGLCRRSGKSWVSRLIYPRFSAPRRSKMAQKRDRALNRVLPGVPAVTGVRRAAAESTGEGAGAQPIAPATPPTMVLRPSLMARISSHLASATGRSMRQAAPAPHRREKTEHWQAIASVATEAPLRVLAGRN